MNVPHKTIFVSEALGAYGMSLWRILCSLLSSRTSVLMRFGPVPVSKLQIIERKRDELNPMEMNTL